MALPWLYHNGAGEPDSNAMLVGIYQAVLQRLWMGGDLYMLQGQPLYYGLAFLIQGPLRLSYDNLALAMNLLAAILSAGTSVLLYKVIAIFSDRLTAFAVAALTISSATVFEWSTYTHPVTLSHFLFFGSLFAMIKALTGRAAGTRRFAQIAWFNAGVLGGAAAVAARADVVILFHLYVLVPILWRLIETDGRIGKDIWKRLLFPAAFAAVFTAALGIALLQVLTGTSAAQSGGAVPLKLLETLLFYLRFIPLTDGLLEIAFGFGIAGSALFLAGLARSAVRRKWLVIVVALLMIIPPLVLAMTVVQPARRWFSAIYTAALATAALWSGTPEPLRRRWMAAYGIAAIAINLYLLPVFGTALRRSGVPVDDHTLLYRATADVFRHHRLNQQYLIRVYAQMRDIRENAPDDSLLVGGFAHLYFLMATYSQDGLMANSHLTVEGKGYYVSRVDSLDRFYVAEAHSWSSTEPLDFKPPAIYQFGPWLPEEWKLPDVPVWVLTPDHKERYSMWLRRP